jgi:hypothetical protein
MPLRIVAVSATGTLPHLTPRLCYFKTHAHAHAIFIKECLFELLQSLQQVRYLLFTLTLTFTLIYFKTNQGTGHHVW